MPVTDELLARNKRYAESFPGPAALRPRLRLAVVACMDSRIDVHGALGLEIGDAHVIRNAMVKFTDDELKSAIEQDTGVRPPWATEAFTDLDADVRQSIGRLKKNPFVPHTGQVRGFVFDVATGLLREVQ